MKLTSKNQSFLAILFLIATWSMQIIIASVSAQSENTTAFNIQLHYLVDVEPEIQEIFESAKQRWERVVISDIGTTVTVLQGQQLCGIEAPETEDVDDLLIYVQVVPIDGEGNILARAGPCAADTEQRIRVGYMEFDLDDVRSLIQTNRANVTILHEMGHVLGFGTLWQSKGLVGKVDDHELDDYKIRYLGEQGNIGNEEVGMEYEAVVEDSGGQGTAGSHWEEDIYEDELMTGFVPSSGVILMSRLTVRSLADLGYSVDPEQADEFQVDPEIVESLDWDDVKAEFKSNLRGSEPTAKKSNSRHNKQNYGQDVLQFPIIPLDSKPKRR